MLDSIHYWTQIDWFGSNLRNTYFHYLSDNKIDHGVYNNIIHNKQNYLKFYGIYKERSYIDYTKVNIIPYTPLFWRGSWLQMQT